MSGERREVAKQTHCGICFGLRHFPPLVGTLLRFCQSGERNQERDERVQQTLKERVLLTRTPFLYSPNNNCYQEIRDSDY
jgi:hypothetical protein